MPLWKQATLALFLTAAAVLGWAAFVPGAQPTLERIGLLAPLQRIGVIAPMDATDAPRPGGGPPGAGARVIASPIGTGTMNDEITAIGTAQAIRAVVITPEVGGRISEVLVRSGDTVSEGQVLARIDSAAEEIALERARLVLADAEATAERLGRLQASGAATEVAIRDAALAVETARLGLRQAEFDLSRRILTAPIAGAVGIVAIEPGAQVTPQTEITRIDDRSRLLIEFRIPERLVARVGTGDPALIAPLARPGQVLEGRIRAIDNRVDQTTRSLLVQAELDNPLDDLRAGMAFSITLRFEGDEWPAVDPLSVQWGAEGAFVWAVRDGRATRVPVRIMQRTADTVLVRGDLAAGDVVIREGVTNLRPGAPVQVDGASASGPAGAAAPPDHTAPAPDQRGENAEARASAAPVEG
ncbi:efflux RND transporter periplasmic adaptor subunit [Plastorhodobacter daqingensis]|uniref:Efflux RND transporter periplasmic adaptor subunit n=1 Tax=Plastorhodobacter daqingensis TaxID=1387281 RepID=A0ABW2UNG6_9RHOB